MLQKTAKLKHSFTRKSSATLSVLFTQPTKQSVVFVMTCRHVGCFRFLETENCKKKSPWTKVATNTTSKRHKFMKASKGFPKRHVTFSNLKLNPKPSKLHVATNLSVQKVCHLPKLPPNIFTFQKPHKTAQKCMSTSGLKAIP